MTAAPVAVRPAARVASILVAHRAPLVLEGLTRLVASAASLRLCGAATTADEAATIAERTDPDIVVCGLRFADGLAPELCRRLKARCPACLILIFTELERSALLEACMEAGAYGVLRKDAQRHSLMGALSDAWRIGRDDVTGPHGPAIVPLSPSRASSTEDLTPREYEVLRLTARGLTCREVAEELFLAPNTVRSYCQSVLTKLGVRNKLQAVELARRTGLI